MGKRKLNFGESIFFIFLIVLAAFVLFVSPLFTVREITVEGNRELTPETIISHSGITAGVNIFKVNLGQAAAGIKMLPAVKEVHIYRDFPGRIEIGIVEREPVALLPVKNGFIAVDGDGVYLRTARIGEKGLPVVTGLTAEIPPAGRPVQDQRLAVVLGVIKNLPAGLVDDLSEVSLDQNGRIVLYTLRGIRCCLGDSENVPKKGALLVQILKELKGKQIEYIDLSQPGAPVVKFKNVQS